MGYMHINNLYKDQTILLFKECYALEKIHGTSCHISFKYEDKWKLLFFSGGENHQNFVKLFDDKQLLEKFITFGIPTDKQVTLFGEGYGGKQQGMSDTYGKSLKFIVFDVQIGDCWLSVKDAEEITKKLGLEFVSYEKISTDLPLIDRERDRPSVQSIRNGITITNEDNSLNNPKKREGVVLRPLIEMTLNNGGRVISKHKCDQFRETASPRIVQDPVKLKLLSDAKDIADEWVTPHRLEHVLQKIENPEIEKMRDIINAMVEDVYREGKGEIIESKEVRSMISKKTAELYMSFIKGKLGK